MREFIGQVERILSQPSAQTGSSEILSILVEPMVILVLRQMVIVSLQVKRIDPQSSVVFSSQNARSCHVELLTHGLKPTSIRLSTLH